ncbi:Benzoylformate decarboxylase [Streptomyces ambofaciens ATCC 23877]|uniref:Benzoylformate decarboxylase n=1 Tax=Streptomyces ambofaciens (strain ATCC 23877 / 3486 / DSM 40053 / JCM 4204 / NBRC 12836 / NRRL B-2516) TaxID=278992 RepID=A3KIZ1_STRA7|nr:benzoylformate decarboxylase [Streptomyces ambofaciens]AKZ53817.1 Benzoylformate decarboxylase [Streptomyces ambofaciens ATCC 23877]CAJ89675.1 putative decarboxylase [Streptomyces ambofaciens ATCC 23877]
MPSVRRVSHAFLERQGLTTVFGNPGSNELPFLADLPDGFRYVLGLHEGAVVGMADGYAQATGRPVLVNLHAASGSGNAMGALTNAVASRTPLVVVAGQQVRPAIGPEANLASVDAQTLMKPLVGWAAEPACAEDVPRALAQAVFEARLQRRPTYLSVPYDDWSAEVDDNALAVLDRRVERASVPDAVQSRRLAERVAAARRPALVLGGDIDSPGLFDDAVRLAERLGCPVWAAPSLFRLPFPNRHPQFRGVLPAGIAPVCEAFEGHDLVLVLGAPVFRYHEYLPGRYLPEGTRLVQVTDDASAAARAPMGEALVADPGAVVGLLLRSLDAPGEPAGPYRPAPEPLTAGGPSLHPEQVFAALREGLPADTAYVVESTSTNSAWWRQMDLRRPGSYYFPAAGGLGFGLPGAVGVAMAQPDRPVVGVIGDGSANYGITALWTAAQHGVPLTIVLLRNGTYGALRWFGGLLGVPDAPGLDIPGLDFTRVAEGYGVRARHVGGVEELRAVLAEQPGHPRLIQVDTALTTPS